MRRILIIEDDRDIIELVRYNLVAEGFEVGAATDGSSGLAQVRKTAPDLLILDLMLPKMPGLEVCKEIRRDGALNRLPILMLTARGKKPTASSVWKWAPTTTSQSPSARASWLPALKFCCGVPNR